MSTEQLEQIEQLARRAVACKRWRWMPGMRTSEGWRVIRGSTESGCWAYDENPENWQVADNRLEDGTLPDLTDAATMGCLLAIVREAWGDPKIHIVWLFGGFDTWQPWNTERPILAPLLKFHTEAAALVAALEVAP